MATLFLFGITISKVAQAEDVGKAECIDWDGDGWGWDGEKGCRVGDSRKVSCEMTGNRVFYSHGPAIPGFLFDVVNWRVKGKPTGIKLYNSRGEYVDNLETGQENEEGWTHSKQSDVTVSGYKIIVTDTDGATAECSLSFDLNCEPTNSTATNGGWGYNKTTGKGCHVNLLEEYPGESEENEGNENENKPGVTNENGCYDWDGDGWGWDGEKGCRMDGEEIENVDKVSCHIYTNTASTRETGATLHWYYSENVVKATIEGVGEVTNKENWKWLKYSGKDTETYKMTVEDNKGTTATCTVEIIYEKEMSIG